MFLDLLLNWTVELNCCCTTELFVVLSFAHWNCWLSCLLIELLFICISTASPLLLDSTHVLTESQLLQFLGAWNFTCLHPFSYTPYTNYDSLTFNNFRIIRTQSLNKLRCILGTFYVTLTKWNEKDNVTTIFIYESKKLVVHSTNWEMYFIKDIWTVKNT